MINMLEWLGEFFSPGSFGTVEIGQEAEEREPLYLVLLKFSLSAVLILLIDCLIFFNLVAPTPRSLAIASGCHLVYFLLGYFLRPHPDESNLGLFGTILNDPLSASDDVNRWLMMWQILLLPGRFVAEAVVYLISPMFGRRVRIRRKRRLHLPAISVPRVIRRAVPFVAWSILCAVGAVVAYQTWSYGKETETWKAVDAKVIERWTDEGRGATLDSAKMRMEYEFDGVTYRTVQKGYTSDAITAIFVNPEAHTRVSLQSGVPWPKFTIFVALSALGGGGFLGWVALTVWPELASEDHRYESSS